VLDFLSAGREQLTFRVGLQFRDPLQPPPPPGSVLPFRYIRVQVASPPPQRVDGTRWMDGLRDSRGNPFDPDNPPEDGEVSALQGIAPLGQADPATIVLDRWLAVAAVPPRQALTRTFILLGTPNPPEGPLSFLSVPYPDPSINGTRLTEAGVAYYRAGAHFAFDRSVDAADGDYVAVSLDRFFPAERASADYIVRVNGRRVEAVVVPVWEIADPSARTTEDAV